MNGSGHEKIAAIWLTWAIVLGTAALARADAATRVVCVDPHDPELIARIEGQTQDLAIDLRWVDAMLSAAPSAAEMQPLAQRETARLVVAVQPTADGGLSVHIYTAATHELRERAVPRPVGVARMAASTLAETAALIVRGELSAALSGEPSREPAPDAAPPESASPPAAERPPPTEVEDAAGSEEPGSNAALELRESWLVALGMRAGLPAREHALLGPGVGVRVASTHMEFGVSANTSLPGDFDARAVSIAVRRHAFGLQLLGRLPLGKDLELALGASAGVLLYSRETHPAAGSGLRQTPARTTWTPALGPLLDLRWRSFGDIGLALELGADLNLRPTRFMYEDVTGTPVQLAELAVVEPWAMLALFIELGR